MAARLRTRGIWVTPWEKRGESCHRTVRTTSRLLCFRFLGHCHAKIPTTTAGTPTPHAVPNVILSFLLSSPAWVCGGLEAVAVFPEVGLALAIIVVSDCEELVAPSTFSGVLLAFCGVMSWDRGELIPLDIFSEVRLESSGIMAWGGAELETMTVLVERIVVLCVTVA